MKKKQWYLIYLNNKWIQAQDFPIKESQLRELARIHNVKKEDFEIKYEKNLR